MRVGDDVVDVVDAERAGKAEVVDLHRGGPPREHALPAATEVAVQVDQDVDLAPADRAAASRIGQPADVDDLVERARDARPDRAARPAASRCR